MVSITY